MTLEITAPTRRAIGSDVIELAATVGGERLWFRVPASRDPVLRGEPFACCAIIPAMRHGLTLRLDPSLPVCPIFLEGLHRYMHVVRHWTRELQLPLQPVRIEATVAPAPATDGVVTFFSGGIDGLYTALEEEARIDEAVFVHGVDFQLDNPLAGEAVRRNRAWLATRQLPLVEMASNARFIGHAFGVGWNGHNGACLAGFGHALRAREVLIASGGAWMDGIGEGSHLLSDPLLSSEATSVVHHGYGPMRWEKLRRVAGESGVMELLRVCWQDADYNCGRCAKCRRTMLLLHLLELEAPTFPPVTRLRDALPGVPTDWHAEADLRQARVLARALGRRDAVRAIAARLRRWSRRQWLVRADRAFLGGWLRRLSGR